MSSTSSLRRPLTEVLDYQSAEYSEEISLLIEDTVEQVKTEKVEHEWIRISTQANLEVLRHLVSHPEDLAKIDPPVGAVSLVRKLARQGAPLDAIIRSYRLGQIRWSQMCIRILATLTNDAKLLAEESIFLTELSNDYTDRISQRLADEYADERNRWLRQDESLRVDRVLALLDGRTNDVDAVERTVGYRLNHTHLAVIAWAAPDSSAGDELMRAQRAVAAIAAQLRTPERQLMIARDARTVWAWIPDPHSRSVSANLDLEPADREAGIRVAIGKAGRGVDGFRTSHRQAVAAYEVGNLSEAAMIPYEAVSSLVFLAADLERARTWVTEILGKLTTDTARERELRRTFSVYLRAQQSATKAAKELACHKNTVLYRLSSIEKLRGRPLGDDPLDAALALHACTWFGKAVLQPAKVS